MSWEIRILYISHVVSYIILGAVIAMLCLKLGTADGELQRLKATQHLYMPEPVQFVPVDTTDG